MAQQLKIPWQYAGYGVPQQRVYQPPPLLLGPGRRGEGEENPGASPKPSPRSSGAALATSGKRPRPTTTATDSRSKEESSQRKTGSQGLSSTPHAPRKKRSVLELLPGGVGGSTSSLLLPSTHQLLQKHSYIDSGLAYVCRQYAISIGDLQLFQGNSVFLDVLNCDSSLNAF